MQKVTNTVKMYFPLMPDCYKRYYLEGGHDSICMEEHMIGTESFYNIPGPWEERRQEGYETPRSSGESRSTYDFHT